MMLTNLASLFSTLPAPLREELYSEFNKILKNYRESRWEPTELDGGRFCEIVYSILNGYVSGSFPAKSSKPANFLDACKNLDKADKTKFCNSVRLQIPRVLIPLYDFRNNRGVGHVGGDVNSNYMDATYVVNSCKWVVAELIRIFHSVHIDVATSAVDLVIQRETQSVWDTGNAKRVLIEGLDYKQQTLLLLYNCIDGTASDDDLYDWVEYSRKDTYKTNILKKLHSERLIEYPRSGKAKISPKGLQYVEDEILKVV